MTRLLVLAALAIITGTVTAAGLRYVLRPCDDIEDVARSLGRSYRDLQKEIRDLRHVPAEWTEEYNQ